MGNPLKLYISDSLAGIRESVKSPILGLLKGKTNASGFGISTVL